MVNDLGGARDGTGSGSAMADQVVAEIQAAGGQAVADYGNVADQDQARGMVQAAVDNFGKLDICICNAGILRDKSFKNMDNAMWDVVVDVHLRGTYLTAKAAYDQMLAQGHGGRIVVTSSTSPARQLRPDQLRRGQGRHRRLRPLPVSRRHALRRQRHILAPTALSRLTDDILPDQAKDRFPPEKVSPAVVWLCTDEAKDVTGRTWLVAGNSVSLLNWQLQTVAQKDESEEPWDVEDVGETILSTKDSWPPINPMRF